MQPQTIEIRLWDRIRVCTNSCRSNDALAMSESKRHQGKMAELTFVVFRYEDRVEEALNTEENDEANTEDRQPLRIGQISLALSVSPIFFFVFNTPYLQRAYL